MHRVVPFPVLAGCCKSEHFLEKCGHQSWREELSQQKLTVVPAARGYVPEPISTTIIILILSPWTCDRQHGIVGNTHGEISALSMFLSCVRDVSLTTVQGLPLFLVGRAGSQRRRVAIVGLDTVEPMVIFSPVGACVLGGNSSANVFADHSSITSLNTTDLGPVTQQRLVLLRIVTL